MLWSSLVWAVLSGPAAPSQGRSGLVALRQVIVMSVRFRPALFSQVPVGFVTSSQGKSVLPGPVPPCSARFMFGCVTSSQAMPVTFEAGPVGPCRVRLPFGLVLSRRVPSGHVKAARSRFVWLCHVASRLVKAVKSYSNEGAN